jgi:histidine ammonia-lyase
MTIGETLQDRMAQDTPALVLDGCSLDANALGQAARPGGQVAIAPAGLDAMAAARRVILEAVARRTPVYGVTTGLGSRATEALSESELSAFSLQTLRGRAHASGPPLPVELVRAAMIVRLNTLLSGAAGASPAIAHGLAAAVNAGVTPVVGEIGSIGASDLVLGATMGLALCGEGRMTDGTGQVMPASDCLARAKLSPLELGPRDGLALCSHDSFSAAAAAFGLVASHRALGAVEMATALSLEGFRANLSTLREDVLALRPQAGEAAAGAALRGWLGESSLLQPGAARRLQDPLSFRNAVQGHGAVHFALEMLERIVAVQLNGAPDNPAVLVATGEVVSNGNFLSPHLTVTLEAVSRALCMAANLQAARVARLLSDRFTGLTLYLSTGSSTSPNGLAALLKIAESLLSGIMSRAAPAAIWPSAGADGVEDVMTQSLQAAQSLGAVVQGLERICAIELLAAAQAIDLRGTAHALQPALAAVLAHVRAISPALEHDRPLGRDLDELAGAISGGDFARLAPA